jgi:hypothetical protein
MVYFVSETAQVERKSGRVYPWQGMPHVTRNVIHHMSITRYYDDGSSMAGPSRWSPRSSAHGRPVQVDPLKSTLKAPGTRRLKL